MAVETVRIGELAGQVTKQVKDRLVRNNVLGQLLVEQANRRVHGGGDSQHKYDSLWDHPASRRAGGQPLLDTGAGVRALHGKTEATSVSLTATLFVDGPHRYMVYHQHGFTTKGPNYIPLTNRARFHVKGVDPKTERLVELMPDGSRRKIDPGSGKVVATDDAPDFLMAWKGVKVPQRKIFNVPPEDVDEIKDAVQQAIIG